ncbi:MAG TPA: cyclic nucleotide-binding domain-containing protein [Candidatus Limnocylindria bacterium]
MTGRDALITALAGGWFGSGLSPHARSQLANFAALRPYPAGEVILREGDPTDPFGIVAEGRVALRLLVPERGAVTIMTIEPGDVVGWSALVPPYRSTSTAVALEPTTLVAFDVGELRRALREDAELAATVYPRLLEAVARRLGGTRHQLLDLYAQQAEPVPW